jgi:DNA polymerase III delta subunit
MQRKKSAEQFAYENKMQPYRAQMLYQQAKQLDDPSQLKLLITLNNLELKLKSSSFFQPEEILRTGILSYFG